MRSPRRTSLEHISVWSRCPNGPAVWRSTWAFSEFFIPHSQHSHGRLEQGGQGGLDALSSKWVWHCLSLLVPQPALARPSTLEIHLGWCSTAQAACLLHPEQCLVDLFMKPSHPCCLIDLDSLVAEGPVGRGRNSDGGMFIVATVKVFCFWVWCTCLSSHVLRINTCTWNKQ